MTGEEMERAIEFLLKNQAAFDARLAELDARFEAERELTNQQIRELAVNQQSTQENLANLTQVVAQNSRQISQLSNVMMSVVEGQQSHKDDIDALIKLVGGLIEGRGNGKSGS
ncbi:MAG: hypothetical protein QOD32_1677 [Pyrinomonadaceae bacterium]|jgi:ferritin-like metal-binding protein YciE|nr:hypothetical protein [Pyrinomonadaceae bacterium]